MGRSTTIVYQTDTSYSSSTPPATNSETPFISGGGKVSAWVAFLLDTLGGAVILRLSYKIFVIF